VLAQVLPKLALRLEKSSASDLTEWTIQELSNVEPSDDRTTQMLALADFAARTFAGSAHAPQLLKTIQKAACR
jgi:hypothetical protein